MSLNRDFFKSINYKIISKLSTNSEIIGVNFIKIGLEMTSEYLFEKMWFYMKYIVNFLSGNRYMAHSLSLITPSKQYFSYIQPGHEQVQ